MVTRPADIVECEAFNNNNRLILSTSVNKLTLDSIF